MSGWSAKLLWLAPAAFSIWLFFPGLQCWFQQDDFAWLSLARNAQSGEDLGRLLLAPMAQGTIRPLSERGFFILLYHLFGLDALPFRIAVFLTYGLNLWLVYRIGFRLLGKAWAAALAVLLWGANSALGVPLAWTSAYNQMLCGTTLLGALWLFIRYADSRRRGYLAASWVVFLLGFGVLELNVVFPALALAFALLYARQAALQTAPMFVVSALYAVLHRAVAPKVATGPYAMHWDLPSLARTFQAYWWQAFGSTGLAVLPVDARWQTVAQVVAILATVALAGYVGVCLARRDWAGVFGLAWFGAVLAPVLPLRDHVSDYYLTLPTIGLAWLAARGVESAFRRHVALGVGSVVLVGGYLVTSSLMARGVVKFHRERSRAVRAFVEGVREVRSLHPDDAILIAGVGSALYWAGVNDNPFAVLGIRNVFLTPETLEEIQRHPELGDPERYVLAPAQTLAALRSGAARVYAIERGRLRNITTLYKMRAEQEWDGVLSPHLLVGLPHAENQLGKGWYGAEWDFRWMSGQAEVYLPGAERPEQMLRVEGYCPERQLEAGALELRVRVNGIPLSPPLRIALANQPWVGEWRLPAAAVGVAKLVVELELNRSLMVEDGRALGLAVTSIGVR
jgi:hypothetical protein